MTCYIKCSDCGVNCPNVPRRVQLLGQVPVFDPKSGMVVGYEWPAPKFDPKSGVRIY